MLLIDMLLHSYRIAMDTQLQKNIVFIQNKEVTYIQKIMGICSASVREVIGDGYDARKAQQMNTIEMYR